MATIERLNDSEPASTAEALAREVGWMLRQTRRRLRRTQATVGAAVGLSQSAISLIERGKLPGIGLSLIGKLCDTLGIRASWLLQPPHVVGAQTPTEASPIRTEGRQQDVAHARCSGYVRRRLEREGWSVAQEVEIVLGRAHGWIDILAFQPTVETLLVGEVKTEIHDVGDIQRTVAWYKREAIEAARRMGWVPRRVIVCLFVLETLENDDRITQNREVLAQAFPVRSRALAARLEDAGASAPVGWALALVDPLARRRSWIRGARADGRRTPAPYADYRDFATRLAGMSGTHSRPRTRA